MASRLADLKKAVKDMQLENKITFCHNWMTRPQCMLRQSDLFVMPSYQKGSKVEGFGISYIEAASAGLPAIAGNTGGTREAVLDGETGWCVDAKDSEAMRLAFTEALTSRSELSRRGKLARKRFLSTFEGEIVFTRFLSETGLSDS